MDHDSFYFKQGMLLVNIQNNLGGHYCTERPERNGTVCPITSRKGSTSTHINQQYNPPNLPHVNHAANHQLYILEDKCLDPAIDDDYTLIS